MLAILIIIQLLTIVVTGCFFAIKVIERKKEKQEEDLSKYKDF